MFSPFPPSKKITCGEWGRVVSASYDVYTLCCVLYIKKYARFVPFVLNFEPPARGLHPEINWNVLRDLQTAVASNEWRFIYHRSAEGKLLPSTPYCFVYARYRIIPSVHTPSRQTYNTILYV